VPDPALLARLLQMSSKVGSLEGSCVLTLPDVCVALWIELEIAIQAYLGHRSIMSTVRYTALTPNQFKNFWPRGEYEMRKAENGEC
jgi:hypothetical protein